MKPDSQDDRFRQFAVAILALCALILALAIVLLATLPAQGIAPSPYRALPTSAFSTWPIDPLVRPIRVEPSPRWQAPSPAPTTRARVTVRAPGASLTGQATWWDSWGHGLYAAAGPRLRSAMGPGYLHRYVTACSRGVCVRMRLITSCACSPDTRLIDLSLDAFSRFAAPGLGIIPIVVTW